ncbi:MAG: hypothetical protein AAGC53_03410 [Actinomycetota bacterium]
MTTFEHVRLAVGLAHGVSGATLTVDTARGTRLHVHRGPSADVDLCTLRRSVIGSGRIGRPDAAWADTQFEVGGVLERTKGDIHRRRVGAFEHWFATLMHPGHVFDRLESLDVDPTVSALVEVTLKPDPGLGVTIVGVCATSGPTERPVTERDIAVASEGAYAACLADELCFGEHQVDLSPIMPRPIEQENH